jgi:hypothetical protein
MHKILFSIIACFLNALLFVSVANGQAASDVENRVEFELVVRLNQPWLEPVEFATKVKPDSPFSGTITDKKGNIYRLGGMLLPKKDGRYRLVLTTVHPDDGGIGTMVPELEIDKPGISQCSGSGIVWNCVGARLTKVAKSAEKKLFEPFDKIEL